MRRRDLNRRVGLRSGNLNRRVRLRLRHLNISDVGLRSCLVFIAIAKLVGFDRYFGHDLDLPLQRAVEESLGAIDYP